MPVDNTVTKSGAGQVIIPLDASDSYDDCKDRVHEKMNGEIEALKAELQAERTALQSERQARAELEKGLAEAAEAAALGGSQSQVARDAAAKAEVEVAALRVQLDKSDAEGRKLRAELAQTTARFNSSMEQVVALTSQISQLKKDQEDQKLVSQFEAHSRHVEEVRAAEEQMGHAHEQDISRLEEAYAHVHSALTHQSAASEQLSDLLPVATDDELFGMPAGEDPVPRATRLAQRLTELPSLFETLKAREVRKIALQGFAVGELALFFPTAKKSGDAQVPYMAFNVNPKQLRHYVADESLALVGQKGVRHYNRKYILGTVIEKTLHYADAASSVKYDLTPGKPFYILSVGMVDYFS